MRDFTLAQYKALCQALVSSKYQVLTLAAYLQIKDQQKNGCLILRHDVDRAPRRALALAGIEHRYGLRATYYFRAQRSTFIPEIMDRIAAYGHEIGYHYETLDKCRGNRFSAAALFRQELADFRLRYEIKTVCAHGNPLTKYDNQDIWQNLRPAELGLLGEAFSVLDFTRFAYFSDSGRTWLNRKSQKMPGKESVITAFDYLKPRNTNDVIHLIQQGNLPNICLLVHPERWTQGWVDYSSRYLLDQVFSWGKVTLYAYRTFKNRVAWKQAKNWPLPYKER